jgi:hypothetical protein
MSEPTEVGLVSGAAEEHPLRRPIIIIRGAELRLGVGKILVPFGEKQCALRM